MSASDLLAVGDRLPNLRLPVAGSKATGRPLRGGVREAAVVVAVHAADCAGCLAWLDGLLASSEALAAWDARLIVVLPGDTPPAEREPWIERTGAWTVVDDEGKVFERLGRDAATVVVADRWGQAYEVARDPVGHALPAPRELEEWLKFIGTQCPE